MIRLDCCWQRLDMIPLVPSLLKKLSQYEQERVSVNNSSYMQYGYKERKALQPLEPQTVKVPFSIVMHL